MSAEERQWRRMARDPDLLLDFLDIDSTIGISERRCRWPLLLEAAKDPEGLQILRKSATGEGLRAVYSNFALFRLRDEPEKRLVALLDRLEAGNRYEAFAITMLFYYDIEPAADAAFVDVFKRYLSSENPDVRDAVRVALGQLPDYGDTVSQAVQDSAASSANERRSAVFTLGQLGLKNPALQGNPEIIHRLIALLDDTDSLVRGLACDALAKHGYSAESFAALQSLLEEHPDEWTRVAALDALDRIGSDDQIGPILHEALIDKSKNVRDEAAALRKARVLKTLVSPLLIVPVVSIIVAVGALIYLWRRRLRARTAREPVRPPRAPKAPDSTGQS
jgi:hypothetical protein